MLLGYLYAAAAATATVVVVVVLLLLLLRTAGSGYHKVTCHKKPPLEPLRLRKSLAATVT